jgi:hypothetical protein
VVTFVKALFLKTAIKRPRENSLRNTSGETNTTNSAEVTYNSTYPTVGYSPDLVSLGGAIGAACTPGQNTACLIDAVLANNGNPGGSGKSGYLFNTGGGTKAGTVNVGYTVKAVPITINQTGLRGF